MARHSQLLASAAGLLLVMLLAPARPALAGRALLRGGRRLKQDGLSLPCAVLGGPAGPTWMNAPMTCAQLYEPTGGTPLIATPADTDTVKYGQLLYAPTNEGGTAAFIDRLGVTFPLSASAHAPTNTTELLSIYPLIIVQAEIDPKSGNVTAFQPWLYVPYTTILASLANKQFEGVLTNLPLPGQPLPSGVSASAYIRWTFGSQMTVTDPTNPYGGVLLRGSFDNLFKAVKDHQGVCRPALCAEPGKNSHACQYYAQWFGNTTDAVTLQWDPTQMQVGADDSMLVPAFPATHTAYGAGFVQLYQLLAPFAWQTSYSFALGGGSVYPMGTPAVFSGSFSPATHVVAC